MTGHERGRGVEVGCGMWILGCVCVCMGEGIPGMWMWMWIRTRRADVKRRHLQQRHNEPERNRIGYARTG